MLHILLKILRNKFSVKIVEPDHLINFLSGDMLLPKFGKYYYYHDAGSKHVLVLFLVRDIVAIYKKETQILYVSSDIYINWVKRLYKVRVGDHGQGAYQLPVKILYIMNNDKSRERIQPIAYILCKKIMVWYWNVW